MRNQCWSLCTKKNGIWWFEGISEEMFFKCSKRINWFEMLELMRNNECQGGASEDVSVLRP